MSVFQEEASRLKQDSGALLALVDTSLSQYRGLRSRVGQWEQEAKELLQGQEGQRAVRGWPGLIPSPAGAAALGVPVAPPLSLSCCGRQLCLPGAGLGPSLGLGCTAQCVQGVLVWGLTCILLHVRQDEDLLLQRLELR